MYLTYEEFKEIANKHFGLEVDFYVQLLKRIIDNPNRYCGIFRLTSAKEKIIQNGWVFVSIIGGLFYVR